LRLNGAGPFEVPRNSRPRGAFPPPMTRSGHPSRGSCELIAFLHPALWLLYAITNGCPGQYPARSPHGPIASQPIALPFCPTGSCHRSARPPPPPGQSRTSRDLLLVRIAGTPGVFGCGYPAWPGVFLIGVQGRRPPCVGRDWLGP